jgi:putative zinc finger protein
VQLQPTDCARARESVSTQLDGELPEQELDRLETHLLLCPECSAWAQRVRDVTLQLRQSPLEAPAERFVLPRLRRSWRVGSAVAVTSAAAVVATMFFAPAQRGSGSQDALPHIRGYVGVAGKHFVVSRLLRLEDGVYFPGSATSTSQDFRHI